MRPFFGFASLSIALAGATCFLCLPVDSQSAGGFVALQSANPGTMQLGNSNISGTLRAGQFVGGGGGVTGVNADLLDGLNSTAFLQSVPVPLTLVVTDSSHVIRASNLSTAGGSSGVYGTGNYGIQGVSEVGGGRGVSGSNTAGSGGGFGGGFSASSPTGRGVFGHATASTGTNYGGYFSSSSATGIGVFRFALGWNARRLHRNNRSCIWRKIRSQQHLWSWRRRGSRSVHR